MTTTVEIIDEVLQFKQMTGFKNGTYEVKISSMDTRTNQQNKAQWLWFSMIANTLNRENLPIAQLIKADVAWSGEKVKNMFFDPVIKMLYGVESSTKLQKSDYDLIIDTMTKAFGQRGISLPDFPSLETKDTK